jgi:hypothetical protein
VNGALVGIVRGDGQASVCIAPRTRIGAGVHDRCEQRVREAQPLAALLEQARIERLLNA